jgi:hypothetical protein
MFNLASLPADIIRRSASSRGRKYEIAYVAPEPARSALLRSVVFSAEGRLLAIVPPDPIPLDEFRNGRMWDLHDDNDLETREIVEGTAISLFYDPEMAGWEIATRTAIGGEYSYFRSDYGTPPTQHRNTFRAMFIDALKRVPLNDALANEISKDWMMTPKEDAEPMPDVAEMETAPKLTDCPCLAVLDQTHCYNFVLQHPDNHIVNCISTPKVVLLSIYKINADDQTAIAVYGALPAKFAEPEIFLRKYTFQSLTDMCTAPDASPWLPGAVVSNLMTGESGRIDSPVYAALLDLRGNHPNMQYQYLCLQRAKRISHFLAHFPQYVELFAKFDKQHTEFVSGLYAAYRDTYITKNTAETPAQFTRLAHAMHYGIYVPSLHNGARRKINREVVAEFVLGLTPGRVMHALYNEGREGMEVAAKPRRPRKKAAQWPPGPLADASIDMDV